MESGLFKTEGARGISNNSLVIRQKYTPTKIAVAWCRPQEDNTSAKVPSVALKYLTAPDSAAQGQVLAWLGLTKIRMDKCAAATRFNSYRRNMFGPLPITTTLPQLEPARSSGEVFNRVAGYLENGLRMGCLWGPRHAA